MNENSNVRPLRPPTPAKRKFDLRDPETLARAVHIAALSAFVILWLGSGPIDMIGIGVGVAAIAIAASKRDEASPWLRTHHEFALRTIVVAGAVWTLVSLVGIVPLLGWFIMWIAQPVIILWVLVRCVVALVRAFDRKPIANPLSLLI